jgi:hypothetical protein
VSFPSEIADQLRFDSRQLIEEAKVTVEKLVTPTWENHTHHYPATLYSYLMAAFSRLDLYSCLWNGNSGAKQTPRMRSFLARYLPRDPLADALAIQLWRHTLIHTSRPRQLRERASGHVYTYLLHWGAPQLPIAQHYVVSSLKLSLGLQYLLNDFDQALQAYLADASLSADLQTKASKVWPKILAQEFDL